LLATKKLGRTGLELPRLGMGGASLGNITEARGGEILTDPSALDSARQENFMTIEAEAPPAARDVPASRATKIKKIELFLFSFPMVGVAGGVDMRGAKSERTRLAVSIETDDGAIGAHVGGQANSFARASACAKAILGMEGFEA
jgi:hypothetical protein